MKLKISLLLLFFIAWQTNHANFFRDKYVSPGMSLGYCITSHGFSFGLDCDIGLLKTIMNAEPVNYGISLSKYWINVNQGKTTHTHQLTTINFMMESKKFDFKVGFGMAKNPWGYGDVNLCRVPGLNIDISWTQPSYNFPWLGLKSFYYKRRDWRWLDQPYFIPYVKYKYDFHRSRLKE